MYVRMHTRICKCICTGMCLHLYMCKCTCACTHTCTCIHVCVASIFGLLLQHAPVKHNQTSTDIHSQPSAYIHKHSQVLTYILSHSKLVPTTCACRPRSKRGACMENTIERNERNTRQRRARMEGSSRCDCCQTGRQGCWWGLRGRVAKPWWWCWLGFQQWCSPKCWRRFRRYELCRENDEEDGLVRGWCTFT